MSVLTRVADGDDIGRIAALHIISRQRLQQFLPAGLGEHFRDGMSREQTQQLFIQRMADDDCLLEVAELDGEFAGFLCACVQAYEDELLFSPYLTIEFVEVEPGLAGKGIGTLLMKAAEEFARSRGIRNIDLLVWQGNPRAQSLYGRLGYSPIEMRMCKLLD